MSVGKRDGTGDGGCRVRREAIAVVAGGSFVNRGILLGDWPLADRRVRVVVVVVVVDATPTVVFLFAAATERVTLAGLCSDEVMRDPVARVEEGFCLVLRTGGATPKAGRISGSSSSS